MNETVPVAGVPGLSATLSISDLTPPASGIYLPQPTPIYYLTQNAADVAFITGVNPVITFNKPVKGVSVEMTTAGRFGHSFTMTAFNEKGVTITAIGPGPDAQVSSNGGDRGVGVRATSPLTIRTQENDIVAVQFNFTGASGNEGYSVFDLINFRVEAGAAPDPALKVPTAGLKEWLRADKVNGVYGLAGLGQVLSWPDQSGHGTDAVPFLPSEIPAVLNSGPSCTPVVSFLGAPLRFTLPINGWTAMTVFMASQAYTDSPGWWQNQALIWDETEQWGSTFFTPSETNVFFRFGTTQVNNQPIHPRAANIGGDMTVSTFVHDGTTDSAYTNGTLAFTQGGKEAAIAGTGPNATLGVGLAGTVFGGNIGEILIYDRVLTTAERETVQKYLTAKYGAR